MTFNYPYTDLYTLNLDWIVKSVKELQDIIGTLGTIVSSFNERTGDVVLQADDVNQTMIDLLYTSDPGDVITDITPAALDDMYKDGKRVLIFLTEDGNPNTLYFLYWDMYNGHAVAQEYAPTGAIAGVASINGKTGVVTENAETLVMSSTDTTTIGNRIAALAAFVNTNSNNIAAHSTSIAQQAQTLAQHTQTLSEIDTTVTRIDNTVESVEGDIVALRRDKQNVLTFDSTPTHDSANPVTSTGILAALNTLTEYVGAQLALKQNRLTFDTAPTYGSLNPITSDGIFKSEYFEPGETYVFTGQNFFFSAGVWGNTMTVTIPLSKRIDKTHVSSVSLTPSGFFYLAAGSGPNEIDLTQHQYDLRISTGSTADVVNLVVQNIDLTAGAYNVILAGTFTFNA